MQPWQRSRQNAQSNSWTGVQQASNAGSITSHRPPYQTAGVGQRDVAAMSRLGVNSVVQDFRIEKFLGKGSYGCVRPADAALRRRAPAVGG